MCKIEAMDGAVVDLAPHYAHGMLALSQLVAARHPGMRSVKLTADSEAIEVTYHFDPAELETVVVSVTHEAEGDFFMLDAESAPQPAEWRARLAGVPQMGWTPIECDLGDECPLARKVTTAKV